MPKIYLLRRDDDERMVTVDDDRMRRMRMLFWLIDSQDHNLRTSDDDNNATIKDNDDKPVAAIEIETAMKMRVYIRTGKLRVMNSDSSSLESVRLQVTSIRKAGMDNNQYQYTTIK